MSNSQARPLRGLYAITSDVLCTDSARMLAAAEAALQGGARLLQYRNKRADAATARAQALTLAGLCRFFGAGLIVNDDVELARAVGAAGVHIGASDAPLAEARSRLGDAAIIGVSCGPSLERAQQAQAQGASYVAFGRFFPSRTKPDAPQADIGILHAARQELTIPVCAIGGITPSNAAPLIAAGADLVAAVEGLFGISDAPGVQRAAAAYKALFDAHAASATARAPT